ncbi:MAG: hypothetical protein AAGB19_17215 [Cyanobacteria bacterium P01_F01_bin.3]
MNTQEFETQYQESVSKILNDLQSMAIISNRLESSIVEVGTSVQNLNKMVEDFIKSQPGGAPMNEFTLDDSKDSQ